MQNCDACEGDTKLKNGRQVALFGIHGGYCRETKRLMHQNRVQPLEFSADRNLTVLCSAE